jgi:hypothetical protein
VANKMLFINLKEASFVEELLEKAINRYINIKLSPFLNAGFTTEAFHFYGKIPDESDLLHTYIRMLEES